MKVWQQPLPPIYNKLSDPELRVRIQLARETLGDKLIILGHHYQQDAVIEFADFTGDSFELSRKAADQKNAQYVIFCGVHFMAESADILTDERVRVILPDLGAGCSMADMANLDQTLECWSQLEEYCPDQTIIPITYMNSSAAIKAFVGEHGGAVCTSSNCRNVLEWAMGSGRDAETRRRGDAETARTGDDDPRPDNATVPSSLPASPRLRVPASPSKTKVLFFPDQHLGRNTAHAMGYPLDKMIVWDPKEDLGGNTPEQVRDADFVLWKGHCSVHQLFRAEHVDQVRSKYPEMKVMVHPECRFEVVEKADLAGSTAYIVKQVEAAPPGSQWAIGTEVHLINRLARQHPEQKIIVLSDCQCLCTTMFRIDLPHLCWAIENLVEDKVVNEIKVAPHTRRWATVALERMLSIKGTGNPLGKHQPASTTVD
ncbi:MAG TPA: quinolinate synthase [Tepidisphaeraceae bacterium]|jgi:quinolinate synthase|nr:quinolinate synthase [Tepidisphaeraceae bacterium]